MDELEAPRNGRTRELRAASPAGPGRMGREAGSAGPAAQHGSREPGAGAWARAPPHGLWPESAAPATYVLASQDEGTKGRWP